MKTEHLLVIRFSAIGDVAMTVPVIYSLAQQHPYLRITILSKPMAKPLFDGLAPNVGFMGADLKQEYHGLKGLNALFRRLTAKQFTAVADLHGVLRSDYLRMRFRMGSTKVAHIDKQRQQLRSLTTEKGKVMQPLTPVFEKYARVFEQLGYPVTPQFTTLLRPEERSYRMLPEGIGERKGFPAWIGIATFAAHQGKIYPLEKMREVIDTLTHLHPSCRIFLFGGGDKEVDILKSLSENNSHCTVVPGLLNGFRQELVLMSHLNVMVSMDSANMHLASLVATPVVSIWGATHPYAGFMGWQQSLDNAVQIDMPCRPCSTYGKKPCLRGDYACLNGITPDMVVNAIERNLKE